MTIETLQIVKHEPAGVVFSAVSDPSYTLRTKHTSKPKRLNGVNTQNHSLDIIVSDINEVEYKGITASDQISARLRFSGAFESKDQVNAIMKNLGGLLIKWSDENAFTGFIPKTAPTLPTTTE